VVYEALLLVAILFVAGFILLPWVSPATSPGPRPLYAMGGVARIAAFLYFLGVGAVYFCWHWSGGRRTLPMKTWRIRLETVHGRAPGTREVVLRYLTTLIGPGLAVLAYALLAPSGDGRLAWLALATNFAWALVDPDRAFLHDRLAGTRLVDATEGSRAKPAD
jgi:uncharacterized RDD family membrane protein YckC